MVISVSQSDWQEPSIECVCERNAEENTVCLHMRNAVQLMQGVSIINI